MVPGGDGTTGRESDIWAGRTSWKHYFPRFALWLLGSTAFIVLTRWLMIRFNWNFWVVFWVTAILVTLSAILLIGKIALRILGVRYRLTTQRLFCERGIFSQTVDQTELVRVDDVRIHKTLVDRMFGLGSVQVMSTDASDRQVMIEGIAGPEQVAEGIRQYMRVLRQKTLYVENV